MAVIVEISNTSKVIDTLDSCNLHVHVHTRFFFNLYII